MTTCCGLSRLNIDAEGLKLHTEQEGGKQPLSKAIKEGWMRKHTSADDWLFRLLHRGDYALGGVCVFVRVTADAVAVYQDQPGAKSGKGKAPTDMIFLSSISAVLGREKGSDVVKLLHARGNWWELKPEPDSGTAEEWGDAIAARLGHFRQAKRQSQRITQSTIAAVKDVNMVKRMQNRRLRRFVMRWLPCCAPCVSKGENRGSAYALNRRLSFGGTKEPVPFKGSREGHNDLIDHQKLSEVTDPELQEAQGAHWSEKAVQYMFCLNKLPEDLSHDFALTLRMGAPDGLKRLIWPLAAGEAVVPPRVAARSGSAATTVSTTSTKDAGAYYEGVCLRAFGGVKPDKLQDPVPTFCQGIQGMDDEAPPLRDVVKHLSLMTPEGEEALRRLLWCVQLTCSTVDFCPFLPNLLATLLPFFDEAETALIVCNLLKEAENEPNPDNAANPRIIRSTQQINKQAKLLIREGAKKANAPEAFAHLESIGVDVHAAVVNLLQDGLAHCLPFRALCRVVGSFLAEGSEVILRYALALIKLRTKDILDCTSKEDAAKLLANLGEGMSTTASIDRLTKVAFSTIIRDHNMTRISSFWGSNYVAPKDGSGSRHHFCRPRLFPPLGNVPEELWQVIWTYVPVWARVFDPHLVYTPTTGGYSMRTCLETCKKQADAPMVFFVYTKDGDIVGGFCPFIWARTNGYLKMAGLRRSPEDSFLFRKLKGSAAEIFVWSGDNDMLMEGSELHGLNFGGNAAAISIGKEMVRGSTSSSASFQSPILVGPQDGSRDSSVDFEMLGFEVFALT